MVTMAMRGVTMDGCTYVHMYICTYVHMYICVGDGDDGDEGYYYCALSKRHGSEEHYTTMFII